MSINYPRFIRIGSTEIMWELRVSFADFGQWLRPSSLKTEHGDWLAWCGPLHVAVCKL
jgi:hypothetical protein